MPHATTMLTNVDAILIFELTNKGILRNIVLSNPKEY